MDFFDILSTIAVIISMVSAGFSIYFGLRDRPKIITESEFMPPTLLDEAPGSGPHLRIKIINNGRRVVYLDSLHVGYEGEKGSSYVDVLWETDSRDRYVLNEEDDFEYLFKSNNDLILRDENGNHANRLYFLDRNDKDYPVKGARENLKKYLKAVND